MGCLRPLDPALRTPTQPRATRAFRPSSTSVQILLINMPVTPTCGARRSEAKSALVTSCSSATNLGIMEAGINLIINMRKGAITGTESQTVDLFFRTLFRLGIWAADWEVWYGTKPLIIPGVEHRPAIIRHPPEASPTH